MNTTIIRPLAAIYVPQCEPWLDIGEVMLSARDYPNFVSAAVIIRHPQLYVDQQLARPSRLHSCSFQSGIALIALPDMFDITLDAGFMATCWFDALEHLLGAGDNPRTVPCFVWEESEMMLERRGDKLILTERH